MECKRPGVPGALPMIGRHFTDRVVRFVGIFVGIVSAAPW
jgi:hypothetical protein